VTGLGSVDLNNLVTAWTANSAPLVGTATTVSATNLAPAVNATDTFTITVVAASGTTTPSGNVILSIDGAGTSYGSGTTTTVPLSAGSVAGTATATYQTSFSTAGTHQVLAQFASNSTFAGSTGEVQVNIAGSSSGTGSFSLAASPSTLTVSQGNSGTETLTITPAGGYTGTVLLNFNTSNNNALQNLCYEFTTTLNSGYGSVAVTGTSAVITQLSFDTLPADCGLARAPSGGKGFHRLGEAKTARNNGTNGAPLAVAFAGLILAGFLGRYSRKFRGVAGLIALLAVGASVSACGGGSSSNSNVTPDPPKGTYTVTVLAADSATATITGQTTFTFTIQ
jgi:hypothetical protein